MFQEKKILYLIVFPIIFAVTSCAATQWSETGGSGQNYDTASMNCSNLARERVRAERPPGMMGSDSMMRSGMAEGLSDFDLEQREMERCLRAKGFRRVPVSSSP